MKTWTTVDKRNWGIGEWDNEPDKAQWIDERTGLDCLIVRGPTGALCGYVGVPKKHKYFGKDYNLINADVHGGLTFSGNSQDTGGDNSRGICHDKKYAANKIAWWIGFDCAHWMDIAPKYNSPFLPKSTYKNFDYVKRHVTRLARQLA